MSETTDFSTILNRFYNRIEKDEKFFNYYNIDVNEAIQIATQRATNYLIESLDDLSMVGNLQVDISDYDEEIQEINFKLLPKEIISELKLMSKTQRTIKMGKLQRDDKQFSENLLAGIRNIRKKFIEMNNLTENDILSLHSDACFINTNKSIISNIEGVNFRKKNSWNSYVRYKGIEMFYKYDIKNNYIDYKNVPIEMVQQHEMGLNTYLKRVFGYIEDYDENVLKYIAKFQKQYLKNELPEYFYTPFGRNGTNKFSNMELTAFIAQIVIKEVNEWHYQTTH